MSEISFLASSKPFEIPDEIEEYNNEQLLMVKRIYAIRNYITHRGTVYPKQVIEKWRDYSMIYVIKFIYSFFIPPGIFPTSLFILSFFVYKRNIFYLDGFFQSPLFSIYSSFQSLANYYCCLLNKSTVSHQS